MSQLLTQLDEESVSSKLERHAVFCFFSLHCIPHSDIQRAIALSTFLSSVLKQLVEDVSTTEQNTDSADSKRTAIPVDQKSITTLHDINQDDGELNATDLDKLKYTTRSVFLSLNHSPHSLTLFLHFSFTFLFLLFVSTLLFPHPLMVSVVQINF